MKKNLLYSVALVGSLFVNTAFAQVFVANLSPANETPPIPPEDSGMGGLAVGIATVNQDGSSSVLIIASAFGNTTDIVGAHIHIGAAGVAGPIICPFTGDFSNPMIWSCDFDADRTGALFDGNLYANVHTTAHGGGEIRDQLNFVQ